MTNVDNPLRGQAASLLLKDKAMNGIEVQYFHHSSVVEKLDRCPSVMNTRAAPIFPLNVDQFLS